LIVIVLSLRNALVEPSARGRLIAAGEKKPINVDAGDRAAERRGK
jgi:hypothetical protein